MLLGDHRIDVLDVGPKARDIQGHRHDGIREGRVEVDNSHAAGELPGGLHLHTGRPRREEVRSRDVGDSADVVHGLTIPDAVVRSGLIRSGLIRPGLIRPGPKGGKRQDELVREHSQSAKAFHHRGIGLGLKREVETDHDQIGRAHV